MIFKQVVDHVVNQIVESSELFKTHKYFRELLTSELETKVNNWIKEEGLTDIELSGGKLQDWVPYTIESEDGTILDRIPYNSHRQFSLTKHIPVFGELKLRGSIVKKFQEFHKVDHLLNKISNALTAEFMRLGSVLSIVSVYPEYANYLGQYIGVAEECAIEVKKLTKVLNYLYSDYRRYIDNYTISYPHIELERY